MRTALLVAIGYLCGSLPTGAWFGRRAGVDVRRRGSGNIGATNVARTVGAGAGLLTLVCDIAKGSVPTLLAGTFTPDQNWLAVLVGIAAVVGHVFPVFSRFAGGKGVATGFGVFVPLAPAAAMASLVAFLAVAFWTRYVSVAAMLAAATLPLACVALRYATPIWAGALVIAAIILVRHRANLSRLRKGLEPKFRLPG
jgi:acyl phosphate:glycerol-3-phosphate acyltransferase